MFGNSELNKKVGIIEADIASIRSVLQMNYGYSSRLDEIQRESVKVAELMTRIEHLEGKEEALGLIAEAELYNLRDYKWKDARISKGMSALPSGYIYYSTGRTFYPEGDTGPSGSWTIAQFKEKVLTPAIAEYHKQNCGKKKGRGK